LQEAEGANDPTLRATVFDKLGDLYLKAAEPAKALPAYQEALTFWRAQAHAPRTINTLLNISTIQLALTQPQAALTALDEAWQTVQTMPPPLNATEAPPDLWAARILSRRGDAYVALADGAQAVTVYQDALPRWRALNDTEGLSGVLVALGRVQMSLNQTKEGLANFTEALDLARARNNATLLAKTLNSLGDAYANLGDYEAALQNQQEALVNWRRANNLAEQGKTLGRIGKVNTLLSQQLLLARTQNGLVEPAEGATVRGVVTIKGLANHVAFQKWQIDLLLNGDEQQATSIGISTKAKPKAGAFLNWDTTQYPNGTHKLRLRVVREGANYDEYLTTVIIQN
jgi:tetratricopeptide (TPR) repeat protein